ncbi:hypothetical protein DF107_32295 [Burkholderia stagnalis]|uniref:Uncharacterized protein n=1 Tax=Burkholderia stagnalis TaxID=1503054 RepID=A0A107S5K5_9BURK|nr:hypothetical protein [Burkholderia stagnalis]AOK57125.1 hypothetical protein WT74_31405 [Burkholderia stagnalis]KAB0634374.1 hypothetical protein F7R25_26820 [Burkholderia stagnalis]KVC54367.1 hypothetical protein WS59_30370 [Burkholderia stagnalis]KVL91204.1 hypothetical protein WT03_20400 [Burkholderia stagnalis]KVL95117.1 hypothetical protein WT02_17905 [Burkholderia stagnalis]
MSAVDAPAGRPAAPPAKPKTMLRRLLSHHEIATLLVLLHAPIGASAAKPELPALQEDGLVEMVKLDADTQPSFRLTENGTAVLKGLGYR